MPRRVFVTGASGFVGSAVLDELLVRDFDVTALVHRGSLRTQLPRLTEMPGDLFDVAALKSAVGGCEAVIHLVGIIMENPSRGVTFRRMHVEGTRAVVDATRRAGLRRYIHMSALGTRPDAQSEYHRTKWQAEQYVRQSGLDWTIFRPSMIHGPGGFMEMEARWARKGAMPFLFMPYFGAGLFGFGGSGLLQPVYVRDVARAFVDAIDNPKSVGNTYEVVGPDRMTWPEFHHAASQELVGKRRLAAPMPAWFAKALAAAGLGPLLGFNRDQVIMSQENNVGDPAPLESDFGWKPQPFIEALRTYAHKLHS